MLSTSPDGLRRKTLTKDTAGAVPADEAPKMKWLLSLLWAIGSSLQVVDFKVSDHVEFIVDHKYL